MSRVEVAFSGTVAEPLVHLIEARFDAVEAPAHRAEAIIYGVEPVVYPLELVEHETREALEIGLLHRTAVYHGAENERGSRELKRAA